jgi:hypothetical protein
MMVLVMIASWQRSPYIAKRPAFIFLLSFTDSIQFKYSILKCGDPMYALAVAVVLSLAGILLFLLFDKKGIFFKKIVKKRSGRDRRKGFIAAKNRMRRSGEDRRQDKGKNIEVR